MPLLHSAASLRLAAKPVGRARHVVRVKPGIHPELVEAKIVVNGEEVGTITGTQAEYHVDVWSGNHPFYKGDNRALVIDEGQVNKFKSRYAALGALGNVQTLSDVAKQDKDA